MVDQQEQLRPSRPPPTRRHHRPSRARLMVRRIVALVLLVAFLGLAVWLATVAVGSVRDAEEKPAAPPPAAPTPLRIIFPEGFTRRQMAERIREVNGIARERRGVNPRLSSGAYLRATRSSKIPGTFAGDGKRRELEGFLFPATYEFEPRTTSRQLVNRQLESFERNWSKVNLRYARSRNLTPYDVLIIASMIEKEVIAPEERALVAAVIYNRLRTGMYLGIDATIRYGLDVPPTEPLRNSQLESLNPYNTRKHTGLPPTPIANPGLASMQAAAHPANVDYLYFARKPDKVHHFFTASKEEFDTYTATHGYG
ncbi:MAG TPA: endolytic transglycosylase MltG [Gaiellaceae bacterium]|nr:endolytic transglycosylase MltG [Gaiellaceae bacterium]